MKKLLLITAMALAAGTAFAQAPAGTLSKPPAESNPTDASGKAGAKAQMKVDAKTSATPTAGDAAMKGAAMQTMDTNGDGMISRREYDRYHSMMWKKMNPTKNMVPKADYDAMIKGGPG